MNMYKVFIFNACILMSFSNISAMQENSFSEKELYSEENLQQLKELEMGRIIKLKENVLGLLDTDIKSIQARIKIVEKQNKRIEKFSLKYAEEDLTKSRTLSPDMVAHAKNSPQVKADLTKELDKLKKQKNDFQTQLAKIKRENLAELSLKELKDLYKRLDKELYNKYKDDENESELSEDDISLSKHSIKEQSTDELTSKETPDELNIIKKRPISEEDLASKEICGTTLPLFENNNLPVGIEKHSQIDDITVPLRIESNIEENFSRRIKFTPNGSFFTIPSLFNIITYVINGPSTNKTTENTNESTNATVTNNNKACISAINKSFSSTQYFAAPHTHTSKSIIKLVVNPSQDSNNENRMIICKMSPEPNMQLRGIIEILSNDKKIFNFKVKENNNHLSNIYYKCLLTRNKNLNFNNIFALLLNNKEIFNQTKNRQISINNNFLSQCVIQIQEMSNTLVQNQQVETQKSQALVNQPLEKYKKLKVSNKQKILDTFIEGQITFLETQAQLNDVFGIFNNKSQIRN